MPDVAEVGWSLRVDGTMGMLVGLRLKWECPCQLSPCVGPSVTHRVLRKSSQLAWQVRTTVGCTCSVRVVYVGYTWGVRGVYVGWGTPRQLHGS